MTWCEDNGRHDLKCHINRFGKKLVVIPGFERLTDAPRAHGAPREWLGFKLRSKAKTKPRSAEDILNEKL
jgi:hypothetical protein